MSLEIFAGAAVWRRSARDDAAAVRSGDAAVMRQPCGRYAAVMRQRCGIFSWPEPGWKTRKRVIGAYEGASRACETSEGALSCDEHGVEARLDFHEMVPEYRLRTELRGARFTSR